MYSFGRCGGNELWWGWWLGCLSWSHWERILSCLEVCHSGPSLRAGPPHCRLFPEPLLAWVPSRAMSLLGPWGRVSPRSGLDHNCPPGQNRPWAPQPCLSSPRVLIMVYIQILDQVERSNPQMQSWWKWEKKVKESEVCLGLEAGRSGALRISFKTNVWGSIWCADASNSLDYDIVRQHCFSARHSFKPNGTLIGAISSPPLASVIISYAPSLCSYNAKRVINSIT